MNNYNIHPAVRALSDDELARAFAVCNGLEGTDMLPPTTNEELEDLTLAQMFQHCQDEGCPLVDLCQANLLGGEDLNSELLARFRKLSGARLGDFRKGEDL